MKKNKGRKSRDTVPLSIIKILPKSQNYLSIIYNLKNVTNAIKLEQKASQSIIIYIQQNLTTKHCKSIIINKITPSHKTLQMYHNKPNLT